MNTCLFCNKPVRNKYCNVSCQDSHIGPLNRLKRIDKYKLGPKKCLECNKELEYEKRNNLFCSRECCHNYRYKNPLIKCCTVCGKPQKRVCVCKECLDKETFLKFINNKLNPVMSQARRIMLFINDKCQTCGWNSINEFTNKIPLELHHKSRARKNNFYNNLEILCPNCHSLTNNFRFNLKGNKRTLTT